MKFLLIGHSIIDHIEKYEEKNLKPGGIYYSALGMSACSNKKDTIHLLTGYNDVAKNIFSPVYTRMDLSLCTLLESMPEVILKVSNAGEREEVYRNISPQLDLSSLKNFNLPDGILINMITGYDITPNNLKWIRSLYNCPIYFDVHTLSRGLDNEMKRKFRPIPQISEWLSNVDILQCNENELKTITAIEPLEKAAEFIFSYGVKILIITKAEKGVEAFSLENNSVSIFIIPPVEIETKNKIGCGDIFGAVFFYNYISTQNVFLSLNKANKAGAIAASIENLSEHFDLVLE